MKKVRLWGQFLERIVHVMVVWNNKVNNITKLHEAQIKSSAENIPWQTSQCD